jgi:hypothetical protein
VSHGRGAAHGTGNATSTPRAARVARHFAEVRMRSLRLALLAASLVVSLPTTACRSAGADPGSGGARSDAVTLRVTNDNFSDMDIYALRSGVQTRIGRVTAGTTGRFTLGPTIVGPGDVELLAAAVNGGGTVRSGSLVVFGGQTIDFRVAAVMNQSRAVVQ